MSTESRYEVVWPLAKTKSQGVAMNPRFTDPPGKGTAKRVGFIWDYFFRGDEMFPLIQAGLAEQYPGSSFVPHTEFGNVHGHEELAVLAALPEKLKAQKLDAVVVGVGA
jgi:hypothetical protein